MITAGCKVKIEDIGPLATCIQVAPDDMVELELEGEKFWIPVRLVTVAE